MRSELLPQYVGGFDLQRHRHCHHHCHHHSDRHHHHHLGHIGDAKRYKKRRVRGKKNKMWGTSGDWYWVQRMTRLAVWPEWIWINVARSGECMCGQNDQ